MHFREDEDFGRFGKIEWDAKESCKILNLEGLSFSWSPPVCGAFLRKAPDVNCILMQKRGFHGFAMWFDIQFPLSCSGWPYPNVRSSLGDSVANGVLQFDFPFVRRRSCSLFRPSPCACHRCRCGIPFAVGVAIVRTPELCDPPLLREDGPRRQAAAKA